MYRGTDTKRLQLSKHDDNMLPKKNGMAGGDLKRINTANEWAGEQISGVRFQNPAASCRMEAGVTARKEVGEGVRAHRGTRSTLAGAADSICFYWYRPPKPFAADHTLEYSINMLYWNLFIYFSKNCLFKKKSSFAYLLLLVQEKHYAPAWKCSIKKKKKHAHTKGRREGDLMTTKNDLLICIKYQGRTVIKGNNVVPPVKMWIKPLLNSLEFKLRIESEEQQEYCF